MQLQCLFCHLIRPQPPSNSSICLGSLINTQFEIYICFSFKLTFIWGESLQLSTGLFEGMPPDNSKELNKILK